MSIKKSCFTASILLVVGFGVLPPADAHHSFVMFDRTTQSTVSGEVTKVSWRNPHVMFKILVVNPQGEETTYLIESGSPSMLMNGGLKRSMIKVGEKISVTFMPLVNGKPGGLLDFITKADGSVITSP